MKRTRSALRFRCAGIVLAMTAGLAGAAGGRPAPPIPVETPSSPGLATVCVIGNPWLDGGVEATTADTLLNPNYASLSILNGSALCNLTNGFCASGSPRSGSSWAWFGEHPPTDTDPCGGCWDYLTTPPAEIALTPPSAEISSVEQTVTFPSGGPTVTLNFYLRIADVTSPFTDTLEVQVDGVTQQTFLEPSAAETSYTLRSVDLTAFADGGAHAVRLLYTQNLSGAPNIAAFWVDDISLDVVCDPPTPTALAVDSSGNGILELGETATIQPTWTNAGGVPISLTGESSNFVGPPRYTYINSDTSVDYGTVGAGGSATCTDCYRVRVRSGGPTALHRDATIEESVQIDGAVRVARKAWTLHLGDSFTDVPHDGYYPFIETILHNGVTGGCGNEMFCPGSPTLRSELAVFVLVAREGPTYTPPPCTPPGTFSDVPCPGGPAVDWIEEAHTRGIVAGLSDGTYAPFLPVSRAQMAVFLLKTAGITPPACTPPGIFSDVPCPGGYTNFVEALYNMGITAGCASVPTLQYCPDDPTPRSQMAVFLTRMFHLVLYGP